MSHTGQVRSWRGTYGFAEAEDTTMVYIHSSEIEGGRLRVGREVRFDIEKVEGHPDRVKGVNVSGEAVLAKGVKLVCLFARSSRGGPRKRRRKKQKKPTSGKQQISKQQTENEFSEDRGLRDELKTQRRTANQEELGPVKEKVDQMCRNNKYAASTISVRKLQAELSHHTHSHRVHLVRELVKELKLEDMVTYKKEREETRTDPTHRSSQRYTKGEFIAFYGPRDGERMWNVAGQAAAGGCVCVFRLPVHTLPPKMLSCDNLSPPHRRERGRSCLVFSTTKQHHDASTLPPPPARWAVFDLQGRRRFIFVSLAPHCAFPALPSHNLPRTPSSAENVRALCHCTPFPQTKTLHVTLYAFSRLVCPVSVREVRVVNSFFSGQKVEVLSRCAPFVFPFSLQKASGFPQTSTLPVLWF